MTRDEFFPPLGDAKCICGPPEHRLASQVNELAHFIMNEIPDEPSKSEGACACAIRLLRDAQARSIHDPNRHRRPLLLALGGFVLLMFGVAASSGVVICLALLAQGGAFAWGFLKW